jgi:hypothetical protein
MLGIANNIHTFVLKYKEDGQLDNAGNITVTVNGTPISIPIQNALNALVGVASYGT